MPELHGFSSKAQHRLFRAKAARGEIPKSTVEKRVSATKKLEGSMKALPEKVSSAPGMFFDGKQSEDGMFFKQANILKAEMEKKIKPAPPELPLQRQAPRSTEVKPGEQKPKLPPPTMKKPEEMTTAYGVGRTKCANVQLGYPGTGLSGSAPMGSIPANTGMNPTFGTGAKAKPTFGTAKSNMAKKAEVDKEAISKEDVKAAVAKLKSGAGAAASSAKDVGAAAAKRLSQTGKALVSGAKETARRVPGHVEAGLKGIENMSPEARAAVLAAMGYGTYRVGKKAVKGVAGKAKGLVGRKPAPKPGIAARIARAARALRGR